jgi:signal transduction histidine kinase
MSSSPDPKPTAGRRNRWSYPAKLTLLQGLGILFGMSALSLALWHNLEQEIDAEWQADLSALLSCWRESSHMSEAEVTAAVARLEGTTKVSLGPDTSTIFTRTFLQVVIPTLLLALVAGFFLMRRATRPLLRLSDTVDGILSTGDFSRRVPAGSAGPAIHDLIELFNRMLARIEGLVRGMHDALDNVAHDLRTPLTRLRAVAERGLLVAEKNETQSEALADCLEESEYVLTMLTTLMDVAEAESGTMRLQQSQVDVTELLGGVAELYEMVAEEKGVELHEDLPAGLEVLADAGRIRQVCANLVDNAIKYTHAGGHVRISAEDRGSQVALVVRDDGMGIPPGDLPRIWDRLYRADRSRSLHGLGLGLSFVRAIVEAHGGEVGVESTVNQGSTFTVLLPKTPSP